MASLRRLLAGAALLLLGVLIQPSAEWWIVLGVLGVLLVLTSGPVQRRRPTLHGGRRGGHLGVWMEPPAEPLRRRRSMKARALAVAAKVNELAVIGLEPRPAVWQATPGFVDLSQEEQTRLHQAHALALGNETRALIARYDTEWAGEALTLHDEFVRLGVTDGSERWTFEYPTNPLGLRRVAQHLGVWARRL